MKSNPTRTDLELARQILVHDSSDLGLDDELQPVYDLAVELACRIVERDRRDNIPPPTPSPDAALHLVRGGRSS